MLLTLTPASLSWSPLFAGYYVLLTQRVINGRIATKTAIGDGSSAENAVGIPDSWYGKNGAPELSAEDKKKAMKKMNVDVRAHDLYNQYVPFGYILIALAELNGMPTTLVHTALATLLGLRISHNEFGLLAQDAMGAGRPVGIFGTMGLFLAVGAYNFRLAYPALKRFIGQD